MSRITPADAGPASPAVVIVSAPPPAATVTGGGGGGASDIAGGTTTVSFVCQKCRQPLKPEATMTDINIDTFRALTDVLAQPGDARKHAAPTSDAGVLRVVIPPPPEDAVEPPLVRPSLMVDDEAPEATYRLQEEAGVNESFVLVRPTNERQKRNLNHRLRVAARLFDVLSGQAHVDHPLCEDCHQRLERDLATELAEAEAERDAYRRFLDTEQLANLDAAEQARLDGEIVQLQADEQRLLAEIQQIEQERAGLAATSAQLDVDLARVEAQEEDYWRLMSDYMSTQAAFQNERDAFINKHADLQQQYELLHRINVLNDLFHISTEGQFATINNLRLGRSSSVQVEWTEINAALGQTVLLLNTIARLFEMRFERYRLIPMGSFSKIEILAERTVYELYGSSDLGRIFRSGRFDTALVALLDCVKQTLAHYLQRDRNASFPYVIEADKVNNFSIKLQYNQDFAWTKALKFMMTNLKFLIVMSARRDA